MTIIVVGEWHSQKSPQTRPTTTPPRQSRGWSSVSRKVAILWGSWIREKRFTRAKSTGSLAKLTHKYSTQHTFLSRIFWSGQGKKSNAGRPVRLRYQNKTEVMDGLVVFGIICILFGKKDNKYEGKYWTLVFFSWGRNPILLEQPLDRLSREVEMSENTIDEKNSFSGFESTWICTPNFKRKRKTSNRWSRC